MAARSRGKVLWCLTRADLFAPAFAQAGLVPDRVIYVEVGDDKTVLACMEEGLRDGGLGSVVGEVARLSMTASRRLQLAAERTGSIGIALRRWRREVDAADFGQPTAPMTRWRISVVPSTALPVPGVGRPRWLVELIRARGGESADFELEACDDTGRLGLPARRAVREHPVSFLRQDLRRRSIVGCQLAMDARDGLWLEAAGIVLVRERPGSAKGVMFITLQDETGIANLVVWPKVFERFRRTILSAGMIAVRGRIQREGEVVHLVAQRLTDLSADLADVGKRDRTFPLPRGRGDEFHHGSPTPYLRDFPGPASRHNQGEDARLPMTANSLKRRWSVRQRQRLARGRCHQLL